MARGLDWDALPNPYKKASPTPAEEAAPTSSAMNNPRPSPAVVPNIGAPLAEETPAPKKFNLFDDLEAIGRRSAFGALCGAITGASFGFMEVVRSPKMLSGRNSDAKGKIATYASRFAGFFGGYHTVRKVLHLYSPLSPEMNVGVAAAVCLTPTIVVPFLRPMFPYGVVMVALDAYNGMNDL